MTASTFFAYIRGLPETPSITEVNARSGPSTTYAIVCKVPVGTRQVPVQDVSPDEQGRSFQGKVYQWFRLALPDGQTGWIRDDLLEASGDGSAFGYGLVRLQTFAFALRRTPPAAIATPAPVGVVVPPPPPPPPVPFAPPPSDLSTDFAPPPPPVPAASAPPPPPTPPAVPTPPAAPTAFTNMRDGTNVRSGPGTGFAAVARLERGAALRILDVQREAGGQFRWVKVALPAGGDGWIREDLLRFAPSAASLGLTRPDLYPAPMSDCWWVRGFEGLQGHWGWDFGARTGEPITCGPQGGHVIKAQACARCTPDRPSFKHHNIPLGSSSALNDPGWNFGYGHYVIVQYLNEQLPASSRQELASRGLEGAHLYCMYAHLDRFSVRDGQALTPNAVIGACGDTGNSEATHLHLEVRASRTANDANWAGMKANLLDPGILFSR